MPEAAFATAEIVGSLAAPDGKPIAEAQIFLDRGPRFQSQLCRNPREDGSFTVGPLPPGTYRLDVQTVEFGFAHVGDLTLEAGERRDLGVIRSQPPGRVEVRLRRDDSGDVGNLDVFVVTGHMRVDCPVALDAGVARAGPLAPGPYHMKIRTRDRSGAADVLAPFDIESGRTTSIDVALPHGRTVVLAFHLPESDDWSRKLTFRVRDAEMNVVANEVNGWLHRSLKEIVAVLPPGKYAVEGETDAGHRFRRSFEVPDLSPDAVRVDVPVAD